MILKNRKEFSCLYYPYATPILSQKTLLGALLFDNMYFLEKNFFRSPSNEYNINTKEDEIKDYDFFKEIGHKIVGLSQANDPFLNKTLEREIKSSITNDVNNDSLRELCEKFGKVSWYLPNGQYLFWNGIGVLLNITDTKKYKFSSEFYSFEKETYEKLLKPYALKDRLYSFEESRITDPKGDLLIKVPFLEAESLMISLALHSCSLFNLIPFTDKEIHQEFFNLKIKNTFNENNIQNLKNIEHGVKYENIGREVLNISLPRINGLSIEKVANLRHKCEDQLILFRNLMNKLAYQIEGHPWGQEFQFQVEKTISTEIEPAIVDLENKLKSLKQSIGIEIFDKTLATAPLPVLATSIFTNFPVEWALPASVGAVWISKFISYYSKRSEIKKNGLSFLLKL